MRDASASIDFVAGVIFSGEPRKPAGWAHGQCRKQLALLHSCAVPPLKCSPAPAASALRSSAPRPPTVTAGSLNAMRALLVLLLSSSSAHSYSPRLSPGWAPSQPLLRYSRSSPPLSCAPAELPSKPLLGAITKLGGRVTASDVSAETGTSITETQRQLLVLARLVEPCPYPSPSPSPSPCP